MKVLFLIGNAFGIGGTIRTTFNLAAALADRGHDVEVLSCFRSRDLPQLPLDPAVRLTSLVESRRNHPDYDETDPLRGRPTKVYLPSDYRAREFDLMVERRAERYLRSSDADVVVATRAGLLAWVAQLAPERMVKIGQEHLTRRMNSKALRRDMPPHIRGLDAFVTVSQRDADDYRANVRLAGTRLLFIPNGIPAPNVAPSTGVRKIVMAAGRLVSMKRYDVLIRAFAKVVANHPDWQLRLYGGGEKDAELRELITELGLHNHVLMMGRYSPLDPEWAKASIAAVSSDREPFGMTLVEAMRCGLPVVSTDAPHGPAEILQDGVDGRLVPTGDADALADALMELIRDPQRRHAMAAAALRHSRRYDVSVVAQRYEQLFTELAEAKARRSRTLRERLRRRFARAEAQVEPVQVLGPVSHAVLPIADADVTIDGDVIVRLPARSLPADGATLVGRRASDGREWRLPIPTPAPGDTEVAVRIDRAPRLASGGWSLSVAAADGSEQPVIAGLRDTAALLDRPPGTAGGVHVLLPYRSTDGLLGLRAWRRTVHAEVGDVHVSGADIRFSGRLIGAAIETDEPVLELRCRPDPDRVERFPARGTGADTFHATLPAGRLAAHRVTERDEWDAFLHHRAGAAPTRLGRVLDDVPNKAGAFTFPAAVVQTPDGDAWVRPRFTLANDFAVRVADPTA